MAQKDYTTAAAIAGYEAGHEAALAKVEEIEKQRKTDMSTRLEGRVGRVSAQMKKLAGKIDAAPDDPRAERWKARWLECQQSLANIRDHGRETISSNPVGVEIDVPTAPFSIKEA